MDHNEMQESYYQRNRAKICKNALNYYYEHKEEIVPKRAIYMKKYYQNRKENGLPTQRVKDPDYFKKYYQANKDKYVERRKKNQSTKVNNTIDTQKNMESQLPISPTLF